MLSVNKKDYIQTGKKIVENNPFYNTLNLFLKYYFVEYSEKDFYFTNFIKDIIKNENEFEIFMIFKEYSLFIYHSQLKDSINSNEKIENIVYIIIANVKINYDNDKSVLKPFIHSISENKNEILEKFNNIKSAYIFKTEYISTFKKLEESIYNLEKAKEHEEKAKEHQEKANYYNNLALDSLKNIKNNFNLKYIKIEDEPKKILSIKN